MVLGVQKHNEVNEYLVAQLRNSKILLSSEKAKRKLKVFQSRTLETNVAFEFFCRVPYFDIPLYTPQSPILFIKASYYKTPHREGHAQQDVPHHGASSRRASHAVPRGQGPKEIHKGSFKGSIRGPFLGIHKGAWLQCHVARVPDGSEPLGLELRVSLKP